MSEETKVRKTRTKTTYQGKCPPRWRTAQSYNRKRQFARQMYRLEHEGKKPIRNKTSVIQARRHKFYNRGPGSLGIFVKRSAIRKLAVNQIEHVQVKHKAQLRTKKGQPIKHRFGTDFLDGMVACNEALLNKIMAEAARFARHRKGKSKSKGLKLMAVDIEQAIRSVRGF